MSIALHSVAVVWLIVSRSVLKSDVVFMSYTLSLSETEYNVAGLLSSEQCFWWSVWSSWVSSWVWSTLMQASCFTLWWTLESRYHDCLISMINSSSLG